MITHSCHWICDGVEEKYPQKALLFWISCEFTFFFEDIPPTEHDRVGWRKYVSCVTRRRRIYDGRFVVII